MTFVFADMEPFVVRLRDEAEVRVTLRDGVAPQVEAATPAATIEGPGRVVHHLISAAALAHGMLFINETASMTALEYRGGVLQTSVPLIEGLVAEDVHVPCDRLRAGGPTKDHARRRRREVMVIGLARARGKDLVIYRAPGVGTPLRLSVEPSTVTFDVIRRQNGWINIRWGGDPGELQGWAPSTGVRMLKSYIGVGRSSIACCAVASLAQGARRRIAKLPAGTAIHASPAGPRWGVVHLPVDEVEVEDIPGKDWVRILENAVVYETACNPRNSWVRRTDLHFSPEAVLREDRGAAEPGVPLDGAAPRR